MGTVAEFSVEGAEFALGRMFEGYPDVEVEVERIVPTDESVIPYVWVRNVDPGAVEHVARVHPAIREIEVVDSTDATHLCRMAWEPEYSGVLSVLTELDVTLLSAVGTASSWRIEVRAGDPGEIAALQAYWRDGGVPVTLVRLSAITPIETGTELTDAQREALALAHERGYFETPRRVTQADLAAELGISRQALGSRIRRGLDALLAQVLP